MPTKRTLQQKAAESAQFLVSRSLRPIILEAEVAKAQHANFAGKYASWTGKRRGWKKLSEGGYALNMGAGKWGSEYRVYFPMEASVKVQLERYGYNVESGGIRHRNSLRVNKENLFQELVARHGLRLGENP